MTMPRLPGEFRLVEMNEIDSTNEEAKRLRELEAENARLKKVLAESALDDAALKEIVSGKW